MYKTHSLCLEIAELFQDGSFKSVLFVFFLNNRVALAIASEICAGDVGQRMGCDKEEFQAKNMRKQLEVAS